MIPHLKERIEYAREELAWLEAGAKEGEEPWRGWQYRPESEELWLWYGADDPLMWLPNLRYRRRPKMLHTIDAKGVRHEFPAPMRGAPKKGEVTWFIDIVNNGVQSYQWSNSYSDVACLAAGLCQATEEGAQQQLAALRAACLGGDV